jgi:hypothetical protein
MLGAFCVQCVDEAPNSEASLMFNVMEIMAFLPRDTIAKACRSAFNRIEAVVDDGCTFYQQNVKYGP